MSDIYKLKMHEKIGITNDKVEILRVPGGWIYTIWDRDMWTSIFVPFNNEFQEAKQ